MSNNPLIIIEGIDGTGKTTLATGLAHELEGKYYKTPGCRTLHERQKFDEKNIRVSDRFKFYLDACREDLERMQELQSQGSIVVCDRFLTSTIVHHSAMDGALDITEAAELELLINAKIQILLTAEKATILKRLSERSARTRFEDDEELFIHTQQSFIKRVGAEDLIIDNTNLSVTETLEKSKKFVKQYISLP